MDSYANMVVKGEVEIAKSATHQHTDAPTKRLSAVNVLKFWMQILNMSSGYLEPGLLHCLLHIRK